MKTPSSKDPQAQAETKHTPTPWTMDRRGETLKGSNGVPVVVWKSGLAHGQRTAESEGNTELIRRAVNCHAELLRMLKALISHPPVLEALAPRESLGSLLAQAEAAIAEAEKKP